MSFLNLMQDKLKPKEVDNALEKILNELETLNGKITNITDASEISYKNTTSHLLATNVQSAIDEVNNLVGNCVSKSDITVKDDIKVEFGVYNMTYSGDNFVTNGIKISSGNRYFIFAVVLSGNVNPNKAFLYSSWNNTTYLLN